MAAGRRFDAGSGPVPYSEAVSRSCPRTHPRLHVESSTLEEPSVLSVRASPARQAMPILSVSGLSKRFGGLVALADYDLRLPAGTIHGVIGPNGAGKTTLFNLLSRMVAPTTGTIEFDGQDITHLPSDRVARMGITRTFQNIRLFDDLTVLDNVKVGVQAHHTERFIATLLSRPSFRAREVEIEARARELLARVGLASSASRTGSSLPYGDQRRLEIARALAVEPRILMLDEPNAGMNQVETDALLGLDRRLRDGLGV